MAYLTRAGRYAAVAHHNAESHQLGTFDTERRAPAAVPVKLPKSERLDGNGYGYYFDMNDVFVALDASGIKYEVQKDTTPAQYESLRKGD